MLKAILDRTPWRAEQPVVIVAPMFHAWGFSQLAFAASMACTIITRRKFDPEATLDLVDRHRATGLCVVPVMFDRIMDLPEEVLDTLQRPLAAVRGGVGLADAPRRGHRVHGPVRRRHLQQLQRHRGRHDRHRDTPPTCAPHPTPRAGPPEGTEIRILDGDVQRAARRRGRSASTSATPPSSTATPRAPHKDFHEGFMSSGDVGYLDDAGRLFVVGRDDEMIVSGGENVYPIEVEKTLAAHPDVAEAAVLGVDDEKYGQRLAAFVVLADGASATPDDAEAARPRQSRELQGAACDHGARRTARAASPARSPARSYRTGPDGQEQAMAKPRPLLRAIAELVNAANGVRPLAREGYSRFRCSRSAGRRRRCRRCTWPARCSTRYAAGCVATSAARAAGSHCCSPRSRGVCCG